MTDTICDCGPWVKLSMCRGPVIREAHTGALRKVTCPSRVCASGVLRLVPIINGRIDHHDGCTWGGVRIVDDEPITLAEDAR